MDEATAKHIRDIESRLHQELQINQGLRHLQSHLQEDLRNMRQALSEAERENSQLRQEVERGQMYKEALTDIAKTQTKSGKQAKAALNDQPQPE